MDRTFQFEEDAGALSSRRHPEIGALTLLVGGHPGRCILLDSPHLILGRGETADLRFQLEGISRSHAALERGRDYSYTLRDLGSTNGVFVNGTRVQAHPLCDGDRIALGPSLVFAFRMLQLDEALAVEGLSAARARDPVTGAASAELFLEIVRLELELGQRRNFDVGLVVVRPTRPPILEERDLRSLYTFLRDRQKPGSTTARLGDAEFGQTFSYVSEQEAVEISDKLRQSLQQQFGDWIFWVGLSMSRSLAVPRAEKLLERARL